jgi:hypothetical protein
MPLLKYPWAHAAFRERNFFSKQWLRTSNFLVHLALPGAGVLPSVLVEYLSLVEIALTPALFDQGQRAVSDC